MQAQSLIEAALRKLRVLNRGISLSAEDAADGLEALDVMVKAWSVDALVIPYRTRETLTMTSGTNPHSIGSGGTFNTVKPMHIHSGIVRLNGIDYGVNVDADIRDYQRIPDKASLGRPQWAYYEPSDPLGYIYFDYTPDANYTFIIDCLKPITSFATLTTDDSVPDAYLKALIYNLAVELAPEYDRTPDQIVVAQAQQSLAKIRNYNATFRTVKASVDPALLPGLPAGRNIMNPR